MQTITATNARSNFFQLLKNSVTKHLPTRVSSKEGNVVLISEEDYESLLETAELLSETGFKESIKKADQQIEQSDIFTFDEVFKP